MVIAVTMTGSALPDNEVSGQLNSESTAVYVLDSGHYHLGDGVKPELMPADLQNIIELKINHNHERDWNYETSRKTKNKIWTREPEYFIQGG